MAGATNQRESYSNSAMAISPFGQFKNPIGMTSFFSVGFPLGTSNSHDGTPPLTKALCPLLRSFTACDVFWFQQRY
jgi:hypothetical protein